MVSLPGARNVPKLVEEIDRLTKVIADLDAAIAKANTGNAKLWKITLDAYVDDISRTLIVTDVFDPPDAKTVLTGLRTLLNNKLAAANTALAGIT